jgi:AraC family transcriptional regulator of adaptative response/methylated-DNA-[protein]-cysteine methyltransferase
VARVRAWLDAHPGRPATLATLARLAGLTPSTLQRRFAAEVGLSPRAYASAQRAATARDRLRDGAPVVDALFDAGFESVSAGYAHMVTWAGMTPAEVGRGGAGLAITYALRDCALGRLLVATTPRGVCGVSVGDEDADLVAWLRAQYPRATVAEGRPADPAWLDEVVARAAGAAPARDVPVHVPASVFERRVWQALLRVPRGRTRSYGALAASVGAPGAARAVGRACARNPVALLIPCHRAVPATGQPGQYRWGAARKRALLARERGAEP